MFDGQFFVITPEAGTIIYRWLTSAESEPAVTSQPPEKPDAAKAVPLAALVDRAMKAYCTGLTAEEKSGVAARLKEIAGTANYRAVTSEETLRRIYEEFGEGHV